MNKETVLEKARKQKDERELAIELKSQRLLAIVVTALLVVFGVAMNTYEILDLPLALDAALLADTAYFILTAGWCAREFYLYAKLKSKGTLAVATLLAVAVIASLASIVLQLL